MKKIRKVRTSTLIFSLCFSGLGTIQAAPTIENVLINPPAQDGWIIVPATGVPGVDVVRVSFEAKVVGESCENFKKSVGLMDLRRCQIVNIPRNLWYNPGSSFKSIAYGCSAPTLENPATTGRVALFFEVSKTVNGAPLKLCAEDIAGERVIDTYRVSYGKPVVAVRIPNVTFSDKNKILKVQGNVVPKGQTNMAGATVRISDQSGNEIAVGSVSQNRFNIAVPMEFAPTSVKAKVVNKESPSKAVRTIK